MKNRILSFMFLLLVGKLFAQLPDSIKQALRQQFKAKELIQSGVTLSKITPQYIGDEIKVGSYTNIRYQDKFFEFNYTYGKIANVYGYYAKILDTINFRETALAIHIPLKKLMTGRRLWDINGILFVPSLSIGASKVSAGYNSSVYGLKISPEASLQFPYFALSARLNTDYKFNASKITGLKSFAFTPEIGVTFDGLYSVFDPQNVFTGSYQGARDYKTVQFKEKIYEDGNKNTVTETWEVTTNHHDEYNFKTYARDVGPFAAIAPHYSYNNYSYCGATQMYGAGYHLRVAVFSLDFMASFGKLGFASSYDKAITITNPAPNENKINKKDFLFNGTYNASKYTARFGVDAIALLSNILYKKSSDDNAKAATKFTRLNVGVGFGYATIDKPQYARSYLQNVRDSIFNLDYTLLSSPQNNASFSENSFFFTYFVSFEAGAFMMSLENYKYKYIPLSNVPTFTVAYLLPYGRIFKKYKALYALKRAIRN
jgi:hypothetical protein